MRILILFAVLVGFLEAGEIVPPVLGAGCKVVFFWLRLLVLLNSTCILFIRTVSMLAGTPARLLYIV